MGAEMKASLILELDDRLKGKEGAAVRSIDKVEARATRASAASARAASSRTVIATRGSAAQARATVAQAKASERLAASTGIYHGHIMNLRRRAEGGGPSAMALGRTYAMTRAFDHLNKKAEEYYAISRRLPRAEREAAAAAAVARGQQVRYYGLARRDERLRGGAFNGSAAGVAGSRWRRRAERTAAAEAVAAAPASGVASTAAAGIGAGLAVRGGMLAAGVGGAGSVVGLGAIAAATPNALALEKAMEDVRRSTGASAAELETYQARVLELARATGRSKEEIAGLMAAGATERRRGQDLVDYTRLAARASQAWGQQSRQTGEGLTALGNIYQANQQRLEGIADAIQSAASATRTRAGDISGFMREVGQEGAGVGLSAENMAAYGAAFRHAGTEATAAQKAMSSIVSTFAEAGDQGRDFNNALRSMGLRTEAFSRAFKRDANGTILDFLTRLNRLSPDKRNDAISNIFGNDQAEEIRRLAASVPRLRELQSLLGDRNRTRGAVGREADLVSQNDFARIERAQQALDTLMARIGNAGKRVAGSVANAINAAVDNYERYQDGQRRGDAALAREHYDRRIAALDEEAKKARENYDFRRQEELALQRQRLEGLRAEARQREMEHQLARRSAEVTPPSNADIVRQIEETNSAARRKFFDDVLRHGPPQARPDALRRRDRQQMAPEVLAREDRRNAPASAEPAGPGMREWLAGLQEQRGKAEEEAAKIREAIQSIQDAVAGQGGRASQAQSYELRALNDALNKANAEIDRTSQHMSQSLGQGAEQGAQRVGAALDGAAAQAFAAGQKISAQLAAGITAGGPAVSAAMQGVAARAMRNVPQSPAKEGPFRRLGHAGEQIVAQLAAGMDGDGVTDRMRSVAESAMSAARPNNGAWPLPQRSQGGEAASAGSGGGGGGGERAIHVEFSGGITISPAGQSPHDAARMLGEQVAARIRSSLHESRA